MKKEVDNPEANVEAKEPVDKERKLTKKEILNVEEKYDDEEDDDY